MSQSKAKRDTARDEARPDPGAAEGRAAGSPVAAVAAVGAAFVDGLRVKAEEARTGTTVSLAGLSDDELIAALRR